jgi:hypothetical protein
MLFKAFRPQAPNEAEESADLSQKPLFFSPTRQSSAK